MNNPLIERSAGGMLVQITIEERRKSLTLVGYVDGKEAAAGSIVDMRRLGNWKHWQSVLPAGRFHTLEGKISLSLQEVELLTSGLEAARKQALQSEENALEIHVPGFSALSAAYTAWQEAEANYSEAFEKMMDDEHNDGARPPKSVDPNLREEYQRLKAEYPRAALYLAAKIQYDSAHWADNTGAGAAGKRAMEILAEGGSTEEAQTALAARRDLSGV